MFIEYSFSMFETITEKGLRCVYVEIYDEVLNVFKVKTIVFSKKEVLQFLKQYEDLFSFEERMAILVYIREELTISKRKKIHRTGVSHEDPTTYQHEPTNA